MSGTGRTGHGGERDPLLDRLREELPRTTTAGTGVPDRDRLVFDPALKHFDYGYRAADPTVPPALRPAWQEARKRVLALVLRAVSESGWADSLVLRGSMLMAAWFGERAREPHDLDFVVVPRDWEIGEERTGRMLDSVAAAAERLAAAHGGLTLRAADAVAEDIWTYERVPGRRLVLPWSAPGLPTGQVQLDFVFNEPLPEAPEPAVVAGVRVLAATRALSLAWKLVWLGYDSYPQGKDLYDAVLLAESCALPYELVHGVFRAHEEWWPNAPDAPLDIEVFEDFRYVDWKGFRTDYPDVDPDGGRYGERLLAVLRPVFGREGQGTAGRP
ncbi:nucleotidyl transferase AbiEii/AbiGii toxin family protein [Streptomyces sp. NPDC093225]|uniref:nucleotidyl transferase AbiEii/AbiGii toxin family protein n=1 Tax=Streptomyces sp. NPDC093225 TaxID=3366034 RepID=UPI00381FBF00